MTERAEIRILNDVLSHRGKESMRSVASRAGIDPSHLSKMRRTGRYEIETLLRISKAVGVGLRVDPYAGTSMEILSFESVQG